MSRPLRVAFVIQKLSGLRGGAERMVVETARALAGRGIEARIVCFDFHAGAPGYDPGAVPVVNLAPRLRPPRKGGGGGGQGRGRRLLESLPDAAPLNRLRFAATHGIFAAALKRHLQREAADVVVGAMPPAILAAVTAGRRLGIPAIAWTHNVPIEDYGASGRWDPNPLYRIRAWQALAGAECVLVLLPEFAKALDHVSPERIEIMPNPVAPGLPEPPSRERLILGVGRLTAVKRYEVMIEAIRRAGTALAEWRAEIYGDGPEAAALGAQIARAGLADRVRLMGTVDALGPVYQRAGLLCHPSAFEGFGLSVAEAMAHGLPPVGFASCPGINHLITDGQDGLLAAGDDPAAAMSAALVRLAGDAGLRARLGAEARNIASRYAAAGLYDRWEALLRDAAAGSKAPDR